MLPRSVNPDGNLQQFLVGDRSFSSDSGIVGLSWGGLKSPSGAWDFKTARQDVVLLLICSSFCGSGPEGSLASLVVGWLSRAPNPWRLRTMALKFPVLLATDHLSLVLESSPSAAFFPRRQKGGLAARCQDSHGPFASRQCGAKAAREPATNQLHPKAQAS